MKRTATTLMLLAGLGGCVSSDGSGKKSLGSFNGAKKMKEVPGVVGPDGGPVMMTRSTKDATDKLVNGVTKKVADKTAARSAKVDGVVQASAKVVDDAGVAQAAGFARIRGTDAGSCDTCGDGVHMPTLGHRLGGHMGHHHGGSVDPYAYGPMGSHLGTTLGLNGIMPVPAMGPPGAVAAIGAIGPGSPYGPAITGQRTAIKFVSPERMRISWLVGNSYVDSGLTAPAAYNFAQGSVYRLKLTGIPTQPGKSFFPSIEVAPATLKTLAFLSHNSVPVSFTNDDLERVTAGNFVVKVIYLPDPAYQDAAALGGAEELVSTQLEPGADPIVEANRRGTILAVVRLGNIDLENPASPAMNAMPGNMGGGPIGAAMPAMPPAMAMTPPAIMPPAMNAPAMPQLNVPAMPVSLPKTATK
jgi:hypothetical protein